MRRPDFEELHRLLDEFEDAAAGAVLVTEDEYEMNLSHLREKIVKHVEQIEGYARRTARRTA